MMKSAWRKDINDLAVSNSSQVEEVEDDIMQYKDILIADRAHDEWDKLADEFHVE
jgi:hypothetical protein